MAKKQMECVTRRVWDLPQWHRCHSRTLALPPISQSVYYGFRETPAVDPHKLCRCATKHDRHSGGGCGLLQRRAQKQSPTGGAGRGGRGRGRALGDARHRSDEEHAT